MPTLKNLFKNTQHLTVYSYSTGGDMRGGYSHTEITLQEDGQALIKRSKADYHSQEPVEEEYLVDGSILEEIGRIFKKGGIKFWSDVAMSRRFVADGAFHHYSFTFEKESVAFGSQFFPGRYSKYLREIREVTDQYMKAAEQKAAEQKTAEQKTAEQKTVE